MRLWLPLYRATRCPLNSTLRRIPPSNLQLALGPHRYAQGMHQDLAPQGGEGQLRFAYIEDGEPPERYCAGGYHPLSLGDVLHQRYHIVHKLGFGSFSTTWLAQDVQRQDKYVAIKVKTAESDCDSSETRTWRHVWDAASTVRSEDESRQHAPPYNAAVGAHSMPPIWDEFTVEGPNGTHLCVVTEPARMTVAEAQDASYTRLFQPDVARAIAAQLIEAVAFMHTRGYVHADLHLGNILLELPNSIAELSPDQLYDTYGSPILEPVKVIGNGKEQPLSTKIPSHIVIPAWFGTSSEDVRLHEASVTLSDFGEAFMPSTEQRCHSKTPLTIRPPEARFSPEKPLSFAADIWTLACSIWTILGQRPLVDIFSSTDDYVTREQVDALGILPQYWWMQWDVRSQYFDSQGNLLDSTCKRMTLEDRFEHSVQKPRRDCGMATVSDKEKNALLGMLRAMLAFVPEERPTAASLLDCEWMVMWALPDLREFDIAKTKVKQEDRKQ